MAKQKVWELAAHAPRPPSPFLTVILFLFSTTIFPIQQEEAKRLEKERKKQKAEAEKAAKEAQKRIPPTEMFRTEADKDKYSQFDDKVSRFKHGKKTVHCIR